MGMLQWTLASILLATSPVDVLFIPLLLSLNESTPKLEENAFLGTASLIMGLIVALALAWAGTRRRMGSVCMTPQGMAAVKPISLSSSPCRPVATISGFRRLRHSGVV